MGEKKAQKRTVVVPSSVIKTFMMMMGGRDKLVASIDVDVPQRSNRS